MLGGHLDDVVFRFAALKNEEECWMDEEEKRDVRKKKENKMVKLKSEKFEFHMDIFSMSDATTYKSRLRNLSFILELEF